MDCIVTTTIILSVLKDALCFNIDPVAWKTLSNSAGGFGYQVVQRQSDLLVSAPLAQYSPGGRGQIFRCSATSCSQLSVPLPDFAVNMSLGLTMTIDPVTQNTLACGPTIPKDCRSITMYNGVCVEINRFNGVGNPVPSSIEECRIQADIAFLLDGSGSVNPEDFGRMKYFVTNLVTSFIGKDTKFAVVQFSSRVVIHSFFNTFNERNLENEIGTIQQITGGTKTAAAIRVVVDHIFLAERGARPNVKKVLIVITDGESQDGGDLPSAAQSAEDKKIVRFAIGVGRAFSNVGAKEELGTIASSPSASHVFQVQSFDALEKIRQNLQDRIFSIEGSQTGGDSLKMEMSQEGFSAAYVPGGFQMGIVGANQWKGGFVKYTRRGEKSSYEPAYMEPDGYLGYTMAVAKTRQGSLTVVGAPRYQHRGAVIAVQINNNQHQRIDPNPGQSGEYFGAELCAMDLDRDTNTDLILISAPMYMDTDREGRVYVCRLSGLTVVCNSDPPLVLRGHASNKGRFGSSLAVLPDLNTDGISDLAVGAPLENDGQGSIYIFHGEVRGGIGLPYTQRIAGSEVKSGLKFFGMSISQSSFDLSGDSLPDLAVGSRGSVVLLRSKPIVMVETKVSFSPNLIPSQNCSTPVKIMAQICFIMTRHSTVDTAQARINFTFTLDATRKVPFNRAYISEKNRVETRSINLDLQRQQCSDVNFFIVACPEDAFNALHNELGFTFEGLSSKTNLSPSLALQAQTKTSHPLGFEINCGKDDKCVDNLHVDFNFTSSLEVRVGIDELLDVMVSVENKAENSYNSHVILTYPAGLSYRKFTILQGRIECNSSDSEAGLSRGKTDCTIDKPIFKSDKKVFFIVSYGIKTNSQFDRRIFITANATSGNQEHSSLSKLYDLKWIDVKYSILVTIESSLSYNNFTFGKDNLQKPVQQSITVTNDIRELNFTMVIKMPVQLGNKDIWVDSSNLQPPNCQRDKDQEPTVKEFVAQIQKNKLVDCSVAKCGVFRCKMSMEKLQSKMYRISANLSSEWIQQIGLKSAKFLLTGTASLEYDRNRYIFFSTGSNNNPPIRKVEVEVEVYSEPDLVKLIVGGSLGGLVLLALIAAGLFKAGFFKSKYQDMITDNAGQAGDPGVDGEAPTPEPEA